MSGSLGLYYTYGTTRGTTPNIVPPKRPGTNQLINSINEGESITFTTTTTQNYSVLKWSVIYTTTNAADFTGTQSGLVMLTDLGSYKSGSITVTARADLLTEGVESFRVAISWNGGLGAYTRVNDPNWSSFLNDYGINKIGVTTGWSETIDVYFPTTSTYEFRFSTDDSGRWFLDGNSANAVNWNSAATFDYSTRTVSAGIHTVTIEVSSTGAAIGVGLEIRDSTGTIVIWDTANWANSMGINVNGPVITINDTSLTPPAAEYTSPGTYSWTCPAGVTRVNALCIGGGGGGGMATRPLATYRDGGGGGGGGLGWRNNIPVVPGQTYTVVVGAGGTGATSIGLTGGNGGNSFFNTSSTVCGFGGLGGLGGNFGGAGGAGGNFTGDGGGRGGNGGGGSANGLRSGGGGGAGGYSGDGGYGGTGTTNAAAPGLAANANSGGAGGGSSGNKNSFSNVVGGGGGGGVGIYGRTGTGTGTETPISNSPNTTSHGGRAGSGGSSGSSASISGTTNARPGGAPGSFGGGGGGSCSNIIAGTNGAGGAVRLVWRTGSSWPITNVGS